MRPHDIQRGVGNAPFSVDAHIVIDVMAQQQEWMLRGGSVGHEVQ
ncbi:hypothetical protein VFA_001861 [Vibrio furnissii CIP 102972]|nr:hypothetical protein VFA_001861 [Vibrio furnissii CIP 102972]